MQIERIEKWGKVSYDTSKNRFCWVETDPKGYLPYVQFPVVLNVDLTMRCNMNCMHCVTKDFVRKEDLVLSKKLIDWINSSPFLVMVVTGGEPFLKEYESQLETLLMETQNKGLIVDTNGTIFPNNSMISALQKRKVLVRISWDSVRSFDEIFFRHAKAGTKKNQKINGDFYYQKIENIKRFRRAGVKVAIQSVIQRKNLSSILDMPAKLKEFRINQWYIQRFIPSHLAKRRSFEISNLEYDQAVAKLSKKCQEANIECITKKDRRHNCVILLVGTGVLYTQGDRPGEKIQLGTIDSEIRYFDYVSSADHSERYYG